MDPNPVQVVQIPIDNIKPPEKGVREIIAMEPLQGLADSITQRGIIQPIIVKKQDKGYVVVVGERRFLAAQQAGIASIPCIVTNADDKEQDLVKLHENSFREDVNAVDEAKFFVYLKEKYKYDWKEVAIMCSRSEAYIYQRVQILTRDLAVLAALEGGQINFTQARELAHVEDDKIRKELLRITIENGATADNIRIMRRDYESRLESGDVSMQESPAAADPLVPVIHKIQCPMCLGDYPVTEIYPISVCRVCHGGFVEGINRGRSEEKEV